MKTVRLTLIGGPTVLVEIGDLRLLVDPAFSPPGDYISGSVTLTKLRGPAVELESLGAIDAVLLSHDQHADNLDPAGRAFLEKVAVTYTTPSGARRLGGAARGLAPWETAELRSGVRVTGTPARHGPAGIEPIAGDVTGFVLASEREGDLIYLTGDTVYYEGVAEVAHRFRPQIVVLFGGAARTRGPFDLTMTVNDALDTAAAFPNARITAVHTEGWAHFTQSFDDLERSFTALSQADRLIRLELGGAVDFAVTR